MAGAGISEENLAQLVETTGALEFHASARMQVSSKMLFRNSKVRLGAAAPGEEYQTLIADQGRIRKMRAIADQLSAS